MAEIVATQVIQDFAIIMVVASVMALVSYRAKTADGHRLYSRRHDNWSLYSTF
jgi:hypothetical protein